jgi:hypothetical protein
MIPAARRVGDIRGLALVARDAQDDQRHAFVPLGACHLILVERVGQELRRDVVGALDLLEFLQIRVDQVDPAAIDRIADLRHTLRRAAKDGDHGASVLQARRVQPPKPTRPAWRGGRG